MLTKETPYIRGRRIEFLAREWFLSKKTAKILTKNFRCKQGEIDLILEEQRPNGKIDLVFLEVRGRSQGSWVDAIESVDRRKQWRITSAAAQFLSRYDGPATGVRFDIMAWNGRGWTHLEDAYFY
jgi:putative endonuclease